MIVERHFAADKDVKHDAKAPNIHFGPSVHFCIQEFWCSEVEGTTECRQVLRGVVEIRETEVNDLDISCLRDENILNLEIYDRLQ